MPKITDNTGVLKLGRLLQERRESIGMSRETLAEMTGTKYETIRLYEEGQRVMRVNRLFDILEALGISAVDCFSAILGGKGEKSTHALSLIARINTLDDTVCQRLIRQVNALIEIESSGHP